MSDVTALKAILEYDTYVRYGPVLSELDNMQKEHRQILAGIKQYYETYKDKKAISMDELETYFFYLNPMVPKEPYVMLFNQMRSTELTNDQLIDDILHHVIEVHSMSKINLISNQVVEGSMATGITEIKNLMAEYDEAVGNMSSVDDLICNVALAELLALEKEGGVKWNLQFLTDKFGLLRPRTLGHIIARPDGGKTSFALHLIAYIAWQMKQMGKTLLFMNNEEDIRRVRLRLYSAMTGWAKDYIETHVKAAEEKFILKGGDTIKMVGEVDHINKVEALIHEVKPYVVVVDQGPKVNYPNPKLSEVERKQKLYARFRQMSLQYDCIFITIGQADSNAEGRQWIGLNNLDGSKVGIPGELDWCLGIGKSNEPGYEYTRYLNIAKNKLSPHYGRATVMFNVEKCRYDDQT